MDELLINPAVQAGVVPFFVALAVAALLQRTRLMGVAIVAGLVAAVALTMGFSFESLTGVRKLVLAVLIAAVMAIGIELSGIPDRLQLRVALAVAAGCAALWVVQRVLSQQELSRAIPAGLGALLYLASLVESTHRVGEDSLRSSVIALVSGLGAGVLALLGGSALLAQLAIAVGAASGATLLVQMISGRRAPIGWTLAFPAVLCTGLVGVLSAFTGELRWYCLIPMVAVPWATRLVPAGARPVWLTSILTAFVAVIPVLLAVALAWVTASGSAA